MPSLFRRILASHSAKGRAARADEGAGKDIAVAEAPVEEHVSEPARAETAATFDVSQLPLDEHGLIPADRLPPAADTLAELFPPEPANDPFSMDGATELEASSLAAETESAADETLSEMTDAPPSEAIEARAIQGADSSGESGAPEDHGQDVSEAVDALISAPQETPSSAVAGQEEAQATAREELPSATEPSAEEPFFVSGDEIAAGPPADAASASDSPPAEQEGQGTKEGEDTETVKSEPAAALEPPGSSGRDWKLEEKLAGHLEWLDSRGENGLRADLSDADLEGQELIGVKLKLADLHDANLRAADLLLADLRDASLIRADLEDSCLVGANLEAANLEGASLETAMGLAPRQIAGANLRDALLPPHIMEFEAATKFERASRVAWRCFAPLIPTALISWLIVWKTKDVQLLTDSAVIPYLHSRSAATALPTAQIFLLAPLVILGLYLVFQFHLQKVWDAALELPAIFPDGHPLDDRGPAIILGLLRTHFWWIARERSSTVWVEKAISVLVGYWLVPFTLTLFWARYLTMQDLKGTLLQTLLVAVSAGVALHATMKSGRAEERWAARRKWTARAAESVQEISPAVTASALGVALLLLSIGTFTGVPHDRSRAPQYSAASIQRWAADVFWAVGFDPYADLTEAALSRKPENWTGANAQVASVKGPQLNEARFRYAQAYGVFLVNAHLWQSDFEGAYLSEADFRGADLGHSDMRRAILDGALLSGANLNRARLDGAMLARADLRWANLSYASLRDATLVDSRLDGATLYDAQLVSASLARAELEKADLRGSLLNSADLDHADLQQALLWSAKLPGAKLYGARLQGAVAIDADLRGADLREAQFAGTVLNDANLSDADLDRADLRGALELTASQVCSSKSRRGALLDDALMMQVSAKCGGLQ
jgi:uncharacterized protein YjbI with pentapeptide repeats